MEPEYMETLQMVLGLLEDYRVTIPRQKYDSIKHMTVVGKVEALIAELKGDSDEFRKISGDKEASIGAN